MPVRGLDAFGGGDPYSPAPFPRKGQGEQEGDPYPPAPFPRRSGGKGSSKEGTGDVPSPCFRRGGAHSSVPVGEGRDGGPRSGGVGHPVPARRCWWPYGGNACAGRAFL